MSEAMGGLFLPGGEDPTFIPLDEFMSQKLLEELQDHEGSYDPTDLVLEHAFDAADAE